MLNYGVSVWGGALFRGVRGLGYDVVSPPGPNLLSGPTGLAPSFLPEHVKIGNETTRAGAERSATVSAQTRVIFIAHTNSITLTNRPSHAHGLAAAAPRARRGASPTLR